MRTLLVAAMGFLAACTEQGIQPHRTIVSDSADQVYAGMTTTISRDGVRESIVNADSTWVYEQRSVSDLKGMTVTMFDSTGAVVSKITADKGIYRIREQSLDARGHVVATTPGGNVLKTEHLIYDTRRNLITSDTAFTSTGPKGSMAGAHFEADPGFKNVVVNAPRNVKQKGKGIRIGGGTR